MDNNVYTGFVFECAYTTFEGLEEYGRIIANSRADGQTERKDVRRYDYKIMDCADRILSDAGYKIVSKKQKHVEENSLTEINA